MGKFLFIMLLMLGAGTLNAHGQVSRKFYPDQLKTDLAYLKEGLTRLHPGLYRYNSKDELEGYFQSLEKKLAKPMEEKQFYLEIAKLVARIKCGHTYLNPLNMEENVAAQYMPGYVLPFCFIVIDNQFVITHNLSDEPSLSRGTIITAINKIPVKTIIDSLLTISRSDGNNSIGKKRTNIHIVPEYVHRNNMTDIFLPLFFRTGNAYELEVIQQGKRSLKKVSGVSLPERAEKYAELFGPVPRGERGLQFSKLNDSTAYIKVPTFSFFGRSDPFTKFTDSIFAMIKEDRTITNLILDLRLNEGGSGAARNKLLSYILPRDFETAGYKERRMYSYIKVEPELLPYLGFFDSAVIKPKSVAYQLNEFNLYENKNEVSGNFTDFKTHPNRFAGKVYLLSSPVNSSAGFEFAWVFKQYNAGTIIGEPTGGSRQGLNGGNYVWFRLPYSRIEVDVPVIYQAHPGEPDEGIHPDHHVPWKADDIMNGVDTQLKFTLDLIRKGK